MSGAVTGPAGPAGAHSEPPARPGPTGRVGIARWAADLTMGARFGITGGREGWARTVMTALGVGLGVAVLLVATAIPNMLSARDERGDARGTTSVGLKPGPTTLKYFDAGTTFHGRDVSGARLAPDGDRPPAPPGVSEVPAPGDMVVSPALKKLLDSPDGKLLRERLDHRVTGTIGHKGLLGPKELKYYAGEKTGSLTGHGWRIDHWGIDAGNGSDPVPPPLILLIIIGCVVLLLPVVIFIATAVRFGGERRDRRLAALRLVGADSHMTRRIAAGEALFGSLLGLAVGVGIFLGLRQLIGSVELWDISLYPSDVRPTTGLAVLIALAVPTCAVVVTLVALRGIAIEPLGVVRNTRPRRRRLWWRLLMPVLGLALLLPMVGGYTSSGGEDRTTYQVALGAVLVLVGITALLPWLVESVVERFGGGPVPWQLATRRLQLSSGTASRAVSGITVAVAGAIAIQMLFSNVQAQNTRPTGQDTHRAQLQSYFSVKSAAQADRAIGAFRDTKGVSQALGVIDATVLDAHSKVKDPDYIPNASLVIADCSTLREVAQVTKCHDGDVFVTDDSGYDGAFVKPGATVDLNGIGGDARKHPKPWTIPKSAPVVSAKEDPSGYQRSGILATPAALDVSRTSDPSASIMIRLDPKVHDAVEYARNTDARLSPGMSIMTMDSESESRTFQNIRRALFIGATGTLLLIGASMIVSTLEQLRERRRLLSVLVAFGTRRSTLSWSVLWQTAVPVVLGLALSVGGGLTLGAVLLGMIDEPVAVDWASVTTMTGIGAGVIALVTLVSLPPLWRMMRPEGLRTE